MRPSPFRHCPECGVIDPALILGVLTGRLSQLDRLFYQASRPPDPWLARGPSSGAIFRCDDCSTPSGEPAGSCHARLFKLSYQAPSELSESFFWRARAALDILHSAPLRDDAPDDVRAKAAVARAEASRLWRELLCIFDAPPRNETSSGRGKRIARLDKLAAMAGLSPILFYLQEFVLGTGRASLISHDPAKKLDGILHSPPRRGQPKRGFREGVEIALAVEKLRSEGATLKRACGEVAGALSKTGTLTGDAVRNGL